VINTYQKPFIAPPVYGAPGNPQGPNGRAADMLALLALVGKLKHQVNDLEQERGRLSADLQQLDEQIRLASQVQHDLLPDQVEFDGIDTHTLYRPLDRVGGDIYDINRLDEKHLGISMADATGHGMSAALLTVMLKRAFRGKEIFDDSYRLLDPREVLDRVNNELLEMNFKQCQFVTGLYGVYYQPARTLTFARGGHPYPILIRKGAAPKQLISDGPLLGALDLAAFETMTVDLEHGDTVLFYTDGLEALLVEGSHQRFDSIAQTPWFAGLADRPIAHSIADVAHRLEAAKTSDWPSDDVSVIAMTVRE
jgi:serine phosphatase RsbU (regulator of sigma subunit)